MDRRVGHPHYSALGVRHLFPQKREQRRENEREKQARKHQHRPMGPRPPCQPSAQMRQLACEFASRPSLENAVDNRS